MKTFVTLKGGVFLDACCSCRQRAMVGNERMPAQSVLNMRFLRTEKPDRGHTARGLEQENCLLRTNQANERYRLCATSEKVPLREEELSDKALKNIQSLDKMKQRMQRLGLNGPQKGGSAETLVRCETDVEKLVPLKEKLLRAKVEGENSERNSGVERMEGPQWTEQGGMPANGSFQLHATDDTVNLGWKLDSMGRLKTRRSGRELALSILYAAVVLDVHPLDIFYQRFDSLLQADMEGADMKALLKGYGVAADDHSHGQEARDDEEEAALLRMQEFEADKEAAVLTSPLASVYNRHVLTFVETLLRAAAELWPQHENVVKELVHWKWKDTLEGVMPTCILHIAFVELGVVGAPIDNSVDPKVVISEASHLARRYCDGSAPRRIGGCLAQLLRKRADLTQQRMSAQGPEETMPSLLTVEDLGWNEGYQ